MKDETDKATTQECAAHATDCTPANLLPMSKSFGLSRLSATHFLSILLLLSATVLSSCADEDASGAPKTVASADGAKADTPGGAASAASRPTTPTTPTTPHIHAEGETAPRNPLAESPRLSPPSSEV